MSELSDSMFKVKLSQCKNHHEDSDKVRLIKNLSEQFQLTPKQAITFANTCTSFGKTVEICGELQEKTTNEDEFIQLALDICKFDEDRIAICAILGIEYIPIQKKVDTKPIPVRKPSISMGLGGGHAFLS